MLNSMDREAHYAIIREFVADLANEMRKDSDLKSGQLDKAYVTILTLGDMAISLVEALHVIAEAQREQAMNVSL